MSNFDSCRSLYVGAAPRRYAARLRMDRGGPVPARSNFDKGEPSRARWLVDVCAVVRLVTEWSGIYKLLIKKY